MSPTSLAVRRGSCLCKKVQFEIHGQPWTYVVCHCVNCQKFSGSAFMANAFFLFKDVMITEGKDHIKTYEDSITKSGQPLIRSFCGECGSSLFLRSVTTNLIIVNTGSIDDKLETDANIKVPKCEIFVENKRPWLLVQANDGRKARL
ncbi:DUF636 domain protein [Pleurotus eryngii]|uniref:DUF636 domain protein n=1 Tax=Pleurotus eryngii TaxID=5323 RepID=A0A9P5ZRR0_PLEER|nr:DUF636 domain protein [Pleurotus eryngii]